ncbi:sodium:solute symporter family protein [Luteimonas sp. RIT-PG2_3]
MSLTVSVSRRGNPRGIGMRALSALGSLLLALCAVGTAQAESLTSVDSRSVPALPAGASAQSLMVVADRPLAIGRDAAGERAWALDAAGTAWQPLTIPGIAGARVLDKASLGTQAWLLLDAGGGADAADAASPADTQGSTQVNIQGQPATLRVASLSWQGQTLQTRDLPAPPLVLSSPRLAALGDTVYIAGLSADGRAQLLGLSLTAPQAAWREYPGWPGDAAPLSLVSQKFALYVATADGRLRQWSAADGWSERGAVPGSIIPGSASSIGQAHVLYALHPDAGSAASQLRLFHTITGSWADLPVTLPAGVALATGWRNGSLWQGADGSLRFDEIKTGKHLLTWLDWAVIIVYLVAMLGIGGYFYLKDQTASESDFFMGGRSIPFWAAGISLYATNTSSISFIAIPAKAYETNWQYLTNNLIAVMGLMFVAVWIVPLLRRLDLMSVFSYLETRFHPAIRMLASALAILMQIGSRLSVILFLPALAIATITGIDVVWSIMIMGVFTIIYTAMGGMRAVVWTDFVQVFVKMGGAIFAIIFIFYSLGSDFDSVREAMVLEDKTKLLDFSFDLTKATVWGFIFLVVFDVVLTFPKDQVLMQRTLATSSDKEAGRSIWVFAAIMIPGGFVFYSIGTALWMYYRQNPERLDPLLPIDATFPLFIAAELPAGVTGLIIAGIFAAAMSTLSSIINSVATLLSVDFYGRLARNPTEKGSVRFAEWMTLVVGLIGMGLALVLSRYDIHSLFDVSIELAGLLGGGFAGAYTLGMFTRRANSAGVAIGIGGSIALTLLAWSFNLVHPYFYLGISIMLCIVIGYIASLFFPATERSLEGLTIHTKKAAA